MSGGVLATGWTRRYNFKRKIFTYYCKKAGAANAVPAFC